jgi:cyanophycinase-like exopeptidase
MDNLPLQNLIPGPIVLFGSGETSPSGRKVFDTVMRKLPELPRVALLETPAGFELNSAQVIGRVGDFIAHRLQNYNPRLTVVPARQRGTTFSPDNAEIIEPLYHSDMIFMGPGSPSYAVRQLGESLAWHATLARHRLGAAIALASAAVVAVSAYALPVYEIYKVGEDLQWKKGLDLFGIYGVPLVFIPHWNNNDGGDELDTSRCFMGQPRFARLMDMLPPDLTVVGIDEKTALVIYPQDGSCHVVGLGGVTLIHTGTEHQDSSTREDLEGTGLSEVAQMRRGHVHHFQNGQKFSLGRIGDFRPVEGGVGLPEHVWQHAIEAFNQPQDETPTPSEQVLMWVQEREAARQRKDWGESDRLRNLIAGQGWQVLDTRDGPQLEFIEKK